MRLLLIGLMLLPACLAQAQTSTFDLLKTGVNAEAGAMGDAHVATTDDAYASVWNPAGLAASQSNSAAAAHHIWVGNFRTYALVSQMNVGARTSVGAFVVASDSGTPDSPDGGPIGANQQSLAAGVALARQFGPIRLGAAGKFLSERVTDSSSRGFAVDVGAQASAVNESLKLGVAILNLGELSQNAGILTELPATVRGGIAVYPFRIISFDDAFKLLNAHLAFEVSRIIPDERTRFHVGAAAQVLEMVTARAGYVTNDDLRSVTAGLGLEFASIRFDYALVPFSQGFGGPGHQLSVLVLW